MGVALWPFRTHLFTFEAIEYVHFPGGSGPGKLFAHVHTLVAVMAGTGAGLADGKRIRLAKGGCLLIPPEGWFEVAEAGSTGLALCRLTFRMERQSAQSEEEAGATAQLPQLLLHGGTMDVQPFGQWSAMLDELHRNRTETGQLGMFRQHIRLQELLYYLCERNNASDYPDPRHAVGRTIEQLHVAALEEGTTVAQLAARANVGVRQYAYWFKELTGQTPIHYLTELRINEAKKRMLSSNETLASIARSAGFKDVYYFSRRFKQVVGMAPRSYVVRSRRKQRIVALYYGGILLSMGVKPVGANLTWWGGSDFLQELQSGVVDVGAPPSLDTIAELEPDLILMNSVDSVLYGQYAQIAPSIVIPYDGKRTIYEDMRLIGGLVDEPDAANAFMDRYERKALAARERLRRAGLAIAGKTAAIVRIEDGGQTFSVFGDKYGRSGWAIYRGLQFSAPGRIRQLMESGAQIEQRIAMERLGEYAGEADYLFVINEGKGIGDIADRKRWSRLQAVLRNRAFELEKARFSYFDPISLEAQLELLTQLLLEKH